MNKFHQIRHIAYVTICWIVGIVLVGLWFAWQGNAFNRGLGDTAKPQIAGNVPATISLNKDQTIVPTPTPESSPVIEAAPVAVASEDIAQPGTEPVEPSVSPAPTSSPTPVYPPGVNGFAPAGLNTVGTWANATPKPVVE